MKNHQSLSFDVRWLEKIRDQLGALPGISALKDQEAELLYALAYENWRSKNFRKAIENYSVLFAFRPKTPKYLEGMARCYYDMALYKEAAILYGYSSVCGADQFKALLRVAQCQVFLNKIDDAMQILKFLVDNASKEEVIPQNISKQAKALLDMLRSKISHKSKKS